MTMHPFPAAMVVQAPALVAVDDLTATKDATFPADEIDLAWTDRSRGESGYQIWRLEPPQLWDTDEVLIDTTAPGAEAYPDTPLDGSTEYAYRVKAVHTPSAATAEWSNTATETTDSDQLAAPGSFVATASDVDAIDLTWDAVSGAVSYEYRRSPVDLFPDWSSPWTDVGNTTAATDSDGATGLLVDEEYRYEVRAVDGLSNPGLSATSNDEFTLNLSAPTGLVATGTNSPDSRINLAWNDQSSGEGTFRIEREDGGWSEIDSVGAGLEAYADTGLSQGDEFEYRVHAQRITPRATYDGPPSATDTGSVPYTAPAAPTLLAAPSWTDNATNETGYRVYYKLATEPSIWDQFNGDFGIGTALKTVTGLLTGTAYDFKVAAFNPHSEVDSAEVSATTDYGRPDVPSSVSATAHSVDRIRVTWNHNNLSVDRFRVFRSTTEFGTYSSIGTVSGATELKDDDGLPTGVSRWYKVEAENDTYGDSGRSGSNGATTFNLNNPSGVNVTGQTTSSITVGWSDNANGEDGYHLRRSATSGGAYSTVETEGAGAESSENDGLGEAETWFYKVRAYADPDDAGARRYSSEIGPVSGTTLQTAPIAPGTPIVHPSIAPTEDTITIQWADNSSNEDGFRVYYRQDPTLTWTKHGPDLSPGTTSHAVDGLQAAKSHDFYVAAFNAGGEVDSGILHNVETDYGVPSAPTSLAAVAVSVDGIDLTWSHSGGTVTNYRVDRADDDGFGSPDGGTWALIATPVSTGYSDVGQDTDTRYHYRVSAYNSTYGDSDHSNVDDALTKNLDAATGLDAWATSPPTTNIRVGWNDQSNGEDGFSISRSPNGTSWTDNYAHPASSTWDDSGLNEGETWYYRVRPYADPNDAGARRYGSFSNSDSATTTVTAPAAPSGLAAVGVSSSQIDLTWTDNSSNETGFKIYRRTPGDLTWGAAVHTTGAGVESWDDTGRSASTTYEYKVTAYNTGNEVDGVSPSTAQGTTTDGTPQVLSGTAFESTTGGTYRAFCSGTVDADCLSVVIYAVETIGGFPLPPVSVGTYNISGGNFTSGHFVSQQCAEVKFQITPYSATGGGGSAGSTFTTANVLLNNFGSDSC